MKSFLRFKNPKAKIALVTRSKLQQSLNAKLPCQSPIHEFSNFEKTTGLCPKCDLRKNCHKKVRQQTSSLAALHIHLHQLGCLNEEEKLTEFGNTARFLPQNGGMIIANMIANGQIHADNLHLAAELFGALSLAYYKEPNGPTDYRIPFRYDFESWLCEYYPLELFPELYDPPRRRGGHSFREYNDLGGYVIKQWLHGGSFTELAMEVSHPKFGHGDLMGLIYRVATYMQSIAQAQLGDISKVAQTHRDALLRAPLTPN